MTEVKPTYNITGIEYHLVSPDKISIPNLPYQLPTLPEIKLAVDCLDYTDLVPWRDWMGLGLTGDYLKGPDPKYKKNLRFVVEVDAAMITEMNTTYLKNNSQESKAHLTLRAEAIRIVDVEITER